MKCLWMLTFGRRMYLKCLIKHFESHLFNREANCVFKSALMCVSTYWIFFSFLEGEML